MESISREVAASKLSAELDGNCTFDKLNGQVIGLFVGRAGGAHVKHVKYIKGKIALSRRFTHSRLALERAER